MTKQTLYEEQLRDFRLLAEELAKVPEIYRRRVDERAAIFVSGMEAAMRLHPAQSASGAAQAQVNV